jgi:hypothetical protein
MQHLGKYKERDFQRYAFSVELTSENRYSVYVPKSFAHGFFTLADNTAIHYQISEFYQPAYARGFRYNDPLFDIKLPFAVTTIAKRDEQFADARHLLDQEDTVRKPRHATLNSDGSASSMSLFNRKRLWK